MSFLCPFSCLAPARPGDPHGLSPRKHWQYLLRIPRLGADAGVARRPFHPPSHDHNDHPSSHPHTSPDPWADITRRQMEWPLQAMLAMLHGAEAMGTIELNYAHMLRQHHEAVLARLAAAEDVTQMWAAQAELLRFDAAGSLRCWQETLDAWVHAGQDMLNRMASAADRNGGDPLLAAFLALQSCMHSGFRPMDDLFNAPYSRPLDGGRAAPQPR